jgi:hypothetical protein
MRSTPTAAMTTTSTASRSELPGSLRSSRGVVSSTVRGWASIGGWSSKASRCCTGFRRLRIRWEIRDDIHEAFLSLACGIICWRRLVNLSLC